MRKIFTLSRQRFVAILIVFVFASVVSLYYVGYIVIHKPMQTKSANQIIEIPQRASAKSFVRLLKLKNLIENDKLLLFYLRALHLSQKIKAGVYAISDNETTLNFINRVIAGDVLKQNFKIIEGTTQKQIAINLNSCKYLYYNENEWLEVFSDKKQLLSLCYSDFEKSISKDCIKSLSDNSSNKFLEGLFLADTYQYNANSKAVNLLINAHDSLRKYLLKAWQERSKEVFYKNPYELLIAASILEKESAIPQERRIISGIILNRLAKNMRLQMDPTVIYALGEAYTGKLKHNDLKIASKYNSYKNVGLPPTPITMVSKDAIDAASHPDKTAYLYFVAKGDGTHIFSKSYEEQRQAIRNVLGKSNAK
jgi:UPF0755 protein